MQMQDNPKAERQSKYGEIDSTLNRLEHTCITLENVLDELEGEANKKTIDTPPRPSGNFIIVYSNIAERVALAENRIDKSIARIRELLI